jgi:ABC-2 type transport system ATP-binding protein
MLSVERLSKLYGSTYAVRDVSFEVERGEVVGFLGPNGAGKTTTLRMIAGFLGPTHGTVRLGGVNVADEPIVARRKLGYMPEQCPAYPEMKVAEYLVFRAALKGVSRSARRRQVADVMDVARVTDRQDALVGHLSKGYRQRLGLADALLGAPELLVLDEPTSGLDPNQVRDMRQVIDDRRGRHTILVSTHVLSEVEATCERAIVIHRGRLVAHGTLSELRAERKPKAVDVVVVAPNEGAPADGEWQALRTSAVTETALGDGKVRLRLPLDEAGVERAETEVTAPSTVNAWVTDLVRRGLRLESVAPVGSSLEDAFAALTSSRDLVAGEGDDAGTSEGATVDAETERT